MKLIDISEVFIGILKSREITYFKTDNVYSLIDYSSLKNNMIDNNKINQVYANNEIDQNTLLQKDDILLKLFPPISLIYVNKTYNKTVASSNFAIIRAKSGIDSKILFTILKQNIHQFILNGTNIKTLKILDIKNFNINYQKNKKTKILSNLEFKVIETLELLERKKELLQKISKYYGGKYGK